MNNTLEGVDMEINEAIEYAQKECDGFASYTGRTRTEYHSAILAEVKRLRDELEAIVDAWQDAPSWAIEAQACYTNGQGAYRYSKKYTREPPKTLAQELSEKYATDYELGNIGAETSLAGHLQRMLTEFEERTKKEGGK